MERLKPTFNENQICSAAIYFIHTTLYCCKGAGLIDLMKSKKETKEKTCKDWDKRQLYSDKQANHQQKVHFKFNISF